MIALDILSHFPEDFPYIQTFLSGFVAFVLGVLWFHPKVMGEKWAEKTGYINIKPPKPFVYVISLLLWLISAGIYTFLTQFLTPPTIGALLGLATFLWVGFVLTAILISGFYLQRNFLSMAVDSSYFLAGLYLFAVIHNVL